MKKGSIILPLALAVTLSTASASFTAMAQSKKTMAKGTKNISAVTCTAATASIVHEIKGTVGKMSEGGMTVKTSGGKEYYVPLFNFSDMDDFKNLNLKEGTEVSLKGSEIQITAAKAMPASENAKGSVAIVQEGKSGEGKDITVTVTSASGTSSADVIKVGKAQADIKNIKVVKLTPADMEGKDIFIANEITSGGITVKVQSTK